MLLTIHKFLHKLFGGGSIPWEGRYHVTIQPFGILEVQKYSPMNSEALALKFIEQFKVQTSVGRRQTGPMFTVVTYKQPFGKAPVVVNTEVM